MPCLARRFATLMCLTRSASLVFFEGTPKVKAWRAALVQRASVKAAARADYDELLMAFLLARRSAISVRIALKR